MNFKNNELLDLDYYLDLIEHCNQCDWYMIIEYMSDSNIRADILMMIIEQEESKPIYKCLCCGNIEEVTNHICKKCYDYYCVKMGHAMVSLWKK